MATFDEWLGVYSEAYEALPAPIAPACPNCGHRTLRLVFTGSPDQGVGYAHFWCDTCLEGIGISRTPIPAGAVVRDIALPREEREPRIPNFRLAG